MEQREHKYIDIRPFNEQRVDEMIEDSIKNIQHLESQLKDDTISTEKKLYLRNLHIDEEVRLEVYNRIKKEYYAT